MFLVFSSFLSEKLNSQVNIAFSKGYIGVQGNNTYQANNIKNLSTIGIARVSFGQVDTNGDGLFGDGGTQGNNLNGTIKIYLAAGATSPQAVNSVITLNGALNWRETPVSTVEVFGFILDAAASASITLSGQTYNIVGGSNANTSTTLGLKAYTSTFLFTDGENRSGNAATSGLLNALNAEFVNSPQPSVITLTNSSVIEGQNLVFNVALTTAPTVGNPQVLTYSSAGTATSSGDYSSTFTFSNGVTDNGDATITIAAGVSSFTVTVVTNDDLLSEVTETLIFNIGAKVLTASILDNEPNLTTTGTLKTFSTCSGCTVSPQSFTISGTNLTSNVNIDVPSSFQIATTLNGTYSSTISLTPNAGTLSNTSVFIKLVNVALSASSGTLSITSTGVATKTITLTTNTDNALNFDGTNDIVSVPDNNALDFTNNYTIEAWIKPIAFKAFAGIVSKYHTANSNGYNLKLNGTGNNSGITFDGMSTKNDVLLLNKWNHIAAVNNNGIRKIYINGVEQLLLGTPLNTAVNSDPVIIGQDSSSTSTRLFKGSIDEVRIWSTVRTVSDITSNMNVVLSGNETGLVANYNFDQGIANGTNTNTTSLIDNSSNGLNGSITNFALNGNTSNFIDGFMPSITAAGNTSEVLVGKTLALTNIITGGVWSSTNTNIATVNTTTGIVSGVATGTVSINYSICGKTVSFDLKVTVITCTGTLTPFTSCFGSPSVAQTVVVSAVSLTNNLEIKAPDGYELATSLGGTYSTSISLTPISGNITNTNIYVRLSSKAFNGDHGNLILSSGNLTPKLFPIGLASVNLNVPARVTITSDAIGNKICTGTNVNFTANAINGGLTPTFQWKLNGVNVGTNSLTYSNTSLSNNDVVKVFMTSSVSTCLTSTPAASNSITTAVYSVPVTPTTISGINTVCLSSNAAYTTNNVAFATSYDWVVAGNLSETNSTGNALNTLASNTIGAATIKVRAVNFCGASPYSNDYIVTITNTPGPTANFTLSNNSVCISASSITYTNTSLVNNTSNSPITVFDWDFGDGSTSVNTENSNRTYTAAGKYNVIFKIQSQDNCLASITKPVIVSPLSIAGTPATIDTAICVGTSTTLNLTGYTGSIQWMSSPAGENNWTNLIGENNEILNTANLTQSTDFKAEVRSGVCTLATSATVSITVKQIPSISIFPPTAVKFSDSTFDLPYVINSGNPNAYVIDVFGPNPMPNFTPKINYALRKSPLTISIPPSALGNYVFSITPTELPYACYGSGGQPLTFTLGVGTGNDSIISLIYATPNSFNVGTAITALTPTVSGGTLSATSISPSLTPGLTINQNTGVISGTPTAISPQTTYVVTGTISSSTITATLEITVNEALPAGLRYTSPNVYTIRTAIVPLTPTSTGGVITAYSISPALPPGLTFNTLTGVISGTPSAIFSRTSYVVTGSNNAGIVTTTLLITVNGIPPDAPIVKNERFIFGKPGLPSLMSSFVSPLPTGIIPVWCSIGTQNCSPIVPSTPTAIGRYVFELRSYDTTTLLYSINSVSHTLVIAPEAPKAVDSSYLIGITTNPANIGVQVSGLSNATLNYFYLGIKQVGIPAIGNTIGTKKYGVVQVVNSIESDTASFNVTILDPNSVVHLQKIVDSGTMQSNSTYNFQFKLVVTNLTNTTFTNVLLTDNLQNSVPVTSAYNIIKNEATGGLVANSSFNGNSDINILLASSSVAPLAKDTAKFLMNLIPNGYSGILTNVAYLRVNTKWGVINMQSSDLTTANAITKTPTKYQVRDLILNIPEGFSPNNDGVHDYFVIIRPLNTKIDLEVFNRWGNIVYSSNNYKNDWDGRGNGTFAGQSLVDGGYYYSVRALDDKGKEQVFKGFVIIQR